MRGDAQVIEALNGILTAELTGINQYYVHAKMCQNWGYQRLYKHNHDEAIDEMKHADKVIGRFDQARDLEVAVSKSYGARERQQQRIDGRDGGGAGLDVAVAVHADDVDRLTWQ